MKDKTETILLIGTIFAAIGVFALIIPTTPLSENAPQIMFEIVQTINLPLWVLAVLAFVATELIFWGLKDKPNPGQSKIGRTIEAKAICLLFGGIAALAVNGLYAIAIVALTFHETLLFWSGVVLFLVVAVSAYIYLNSLKYRNIPDKAPRKKKRRVKK